MIANIIILLRIKNWVDCCLANNKKLVNTTYDRSYTKVFIELPRFFVFISFSSFWLPLKTGWNICLHQWFFSCSFSLFVTLEFINFLLQLDNSHAWQWMAVHMMMIIFNRPSNTGYLMIVLTCFSLYGQASIRAYFNSYWF